MKETEKMKIKDAFTRASSVYHSKAELQKESAARLAASIEPCKYSIPAGKVLEMGAGTGFLTRHLIRLFPEREIIVSDLSDAMIRQCKTNIKESDNITFRVLDAETGEIKKDRYAVIAGNFVAQWFRDPSGALSRFCEALVPGGYLLMSFPGSGSFPEWKTNCLKLGLPFTANPLPDIEEIINRISRGPFQVNCHEDFQTEVYGSSIQFFRHLKEIGVSTSVIGKSLSRSDFTKLVTYWDQSSDNVVKITYHLCFLAVKKKL